MTPDQLRLYKLLESEIRTIYYPNNTSSKLTTNTAPSKLTTNNSIECTVKLCSDAARKQGRIQGILDCISELDEKVGKYE